LSFLEASPKTTTLKKKEGKIQSSRLKGKLKTKKKTARVEFPFHAPFFFGYFVVSLCCWCCWLSSSSGWFAFFDFKNIFVIWRKVQRVCKATT